MLKAAVEENLERERPIPLMGMSDRVQLEPVSRRLPPSEAGWQRILFCIVLIGVTLLAYFSPYYDWDLVAYIGSTIALHQQDSRAIQAQAYAALQRELPQDDYTDIVRGSDFRRDVAQNADHFRQQLPFYQIRPLYIWSIGALHASGFGFVVSTRILSSAAILAIGVLLFFWMRRYATATLAAIATLLLLITPVIFTSARTGSPDALSALIVLIGAFEIVERDRLAYGAMFLLVSLLLRTDNAIFVVLLFLSSALASTTSKTRTFQIILCVLAIATVLTVNRTQHSYSWSALLRNTESPVVNPAEAPATIASGDYFNDVRDMIDEARENSVTVFPFIALLSLISSRTPARLKRLVKVVLLSWAARIVLFPHIEDRYFITGAAIIGMAGVAAVLSRNETENLRVAA